jgi:hypothetical protein
MQEQELQTRCEADEDLTQGKTFGGLQLVGFTDGSGPNNPIVEIVNQYIVFNPQVAARITSASGAYTMNGENGGSSLIAADGEIIASVAQVVYEDNTVQIDLSQSNSFTTTFNMEKLRTWQKVAKRVVHMCKPASQHNSCGIAKK